MKFFLKIMNYIIHLKWFIIIILYKKSDKTHFFLINQFFFIVKNKHFLIRK